MCVIRLYYLGPFPFVFSFRVIVAVFPESDREGFL